MKKVFLFIGLSLTGTNLIAQTWNTTGNTVSNTGDFIGTTNSFHLSFKTNTASGGVPEGMRLIPQAQIGSNSTPAGPLVINPGLLSTSFYKTFQDGLVLNNTYLRIYNNAPNLGNNNSSGIAFFKNSSASTTNPVRQITHVISDKGYLLIEPAQAGVGEKRVVIDGNLSIGPVALPNPNPNDYGLYVGKGILTEKVKVAVSTTQDWSDYVFNNDYELMPIGTLQQYILANKHLPGIPSADAMVANGLDIAKTDAMLLQKIEELTLYLIQLKEQNDKLQLQIDSLKNK
jgi:hypothetical protein